MNKIATSYFWLASSMITNITRKPTLNTSRYTYIYICIQIPGIFLVGYVYFTVYLCNREGLICTDILIAIDTFRHFIRGSEKFYSS